MHLIRFAIENTNALCTVRFFVKNNTLNNRIGANRQILGVVRRWQSRGIAATLVQRHLRIGYNRAARLIEQMERAGLVTPMQTNGNRDVLAPAPKGGAD